MTTEHEANRARIRDLETVVASLLHHLMNRETDPNEKVFYRTLADLVFGKHRTLDPGHPDYYGTGPAGSEGAVDTALNMLIDTLMSQRTSPLRPPRLRNG